MFKQWCAVVGVMTLILVLAACDHLPAQLSGKTVPADAPVTITLLHSNDFHSQHEPYVAAGEPEQGGTSRLLSLINTLRDAKGGKDNVLLLSGGDNFQGSIYYNEWKGSAEIMALNRWGYDAVTLGNHEFDLGSEELARALSGEPATINGQQYPTEKPDFLVIATNIDSTGYAKLDKLLVNHAIIEKKGQRFGLLGATTIDTSTISNPGEHVKFTDYVQSVQAGVDRLRAEGVNKIFLMSHTGHLEDARLVQEISGVDVVVAGHDHALTGDALQIRSMGLLNQSEAVKSPYPLVVKGKDGKNVLVVSAYEKGRWLGQIDISFDAAGDIQDGAWQANPVFVRGCTVTATGRDCTNEVAAPDAEMDQTLAQYYAPIAAFAEEVLGSATTDFAGRLDQRAGTPLMGDLVAEILLAHARQSDQAQVALVNRGGIRTALKGGEVRFKDVNNVLPFPNNIAVVEMTGEELVETLDNGLTQAQGQSYGAWPHTAGVRVEYCAAQPCAQAIRQGGVVRALSVQGKPVELKKFYRLATSDYLAGGGDFYEVLKNICTRADAYCRDTGHKVRDVVADWFRHHSPVSPINPAPKLVAVP